MNKKNAGPAKTDNKKETKHEAGHKPWALERETEGLDEEQPGKAVKAEKKEDKEMDDCGCKYF